MKRAGAHYHLMSRTNDRRFLFSKGRVKGEIVSLLRKSAAFSGVRLEAWCVMHNHFHVVCKVVKPDGPVPEAEVLRRIEVLKGARFAAELAEHWSELRSGGLDLVADAALGSWRARMNDVSQFAKTFKELVNIAYKAHVKASAEASLPDDAAAGRDRGTPGYCGSIWSGRFKSTLVEGGGYLATCIRYVELNPVRAGMPTARRTRRNPVKSALPWGVSPRRRCGGGWRRSETGRSSAATRSSGRRFTVSGRTSPGDRRQGPCLQAIRGVCPRGERREGSRWRRMRRTGGERRDDSSGLRGDRPSWRPVK